MKTVWVVEQGQYSGYHVVGVFSTKENAKLAMNEINRLADDKATIAEWDLDPVAAELHAGLHRFTVAMFRSGDIHWVAEKEDITKEGEPFKLFGRGTRGYPPEPYPSCLHADVWAKDEQHAMKIVNEKRTQMIALGEWREEA